MPPRSSKFPQKSRKNPARPRKKAADAQNLEPSDADPEQLPADALPRAPARVVWDRYPMRTERLLEYLDVHPDIAIKLFGDSTKTAKSEGRFKLTAKSNKATAYLQLANGIFSIDEDPNVRSDFAANPNKYAKAVDNYITNS
jgi:hypothetical protein